MTGRSIPRTLRASTVTLAIVVAGCAGSDSARVPVAPALGSYFTVIVQPGDSVSGLARQYRVKEDDLLAMNDFALGGQLRTGTRIRIPAYASPASLRPSPAPPATASEVAKPPAPQAPKAAPTSRVQVTKAAPIPKPAPANTPPAKNPSLMDMDWLSSFTSDKPDPKANTTFLWPLQGQIISEFGPDAAGARNDGIDILAKRGDPVHAAADGTVSYVGNELKGYGNLVLIQHDNGFITAYAHSDTIAVTRGQHVARGDVIAYAGATGDVSEPQLHFELRFGTKAINPKPYLAAGK